MVRISVSCMVAAASLLLAFALAGKAGADTTSANLTINVSVLSSANLTLGANTLSFRAADPITHPVIAAVENPIPVIAKVRSNDPLTLLVIALDDLRNGDAVIPASAITWTAAGAPFMGGALSKVSGQPAARFPTGSGIYSSYFNFFLENGAGYLPGTYSTTINYTLTTP